MWGGAYVFKSDLLRIKAEYYYLLRWKLDIMRITQTENGRCVWNLTTEIRPQKRRHIVNHSFNSSNENMPQHMISDLQIIYFFYEITWFAVEIVDLLIISQTEVSIVNDKFWTQPTITITLEMLLFHCIVNEPAFPFLGMIWDYEWGLTKIVMAFWQQESIFIWIQCFHEI